ncbi:MAG: DUF262 domain-containing protein, partial [Kiritimatiellae bacterium]|nr:DUF262 domain-containing protein [Kiritimatiellia bacterium]
MRIEERKVAVREMVAGYEDSAELGVKAFGGLLNVRPMYQREFVYNPQQRDAVIRTVRKGFPLNVMYWVKNGEGGFEMLDGQQRTISICRYVAGDYSIDHQTFANLTEEEREAILGYKLVVYVCEGTEREKLDWFDVVNTAGEKLTAQERRNAIYAGPWLNEAKKYFSKTGCPAVQIGECYLNGSAIRQQILETVLGWIAARDGGEIRDYMSAHQHDGDCVDVWEYFEAVMRWVRETFPVTRSRLMKGLPWGLYYNRFGQEPHDADALERRIAKLLRDDEDVGDITNQRGIYEYVLDGDERHLSIRAFSPRMARTAYERQGGVCPMCRKKFAIEEMQADHITPWNRGGRTVAENCQMLCADCNR